VSITIVKALLTPNFLSPVVVGVLNIIIHVHFGDYRFRIFWRRGDRICRFSIDVSVVVLKMFTEALIEIIKMQINLPKSKHMACNLRVTFVKTIQTHRSPSVVVQDLKTSSIRQTVVTSKSDRHYTQQQRLEIQYISHEYVRYISLENIYISFLSIDISQRISNRKKLNLTSRCAHLNVAKMSLCCDLPVQYATKFLGSLIRDVGYISAKTARKFLCFSRK